MADDDKPSSVPLRVRAHLHNVGRVYLRLQMQIVCQRNPKSVRPRQILHFSNLLHIFVARANDPERKHAEK